VLTICAFLSVQRGVTTTPHGREECYRANLPRPVPAVMLLLWRCCKCDTDGELCGLSGISFDLTAEDGLDEALIPKCSLNRPGRDDGVCLFSAAEKMEVDTGTVTCCNTPGGS